MPDDDRQMPPPEKIREAEEAGLTWVPETMSFWDDPKRARLFYPERFTAEEAGAAHAEAMTAILREAHQQRAAQQRKGKRQTARTHRQRKRSK